MGFLMYARFFLLVLLVSCTKTYVGNDVCGADEFVLDSYKIREGKFAILEMGGVFFDEPGGELLEGNRPPGEVTLAGKLATSILVDGKMRLYDVLAGLTEKANLFKSYVMRENKIIPVDFGKLLEDGDMSQNIVMQGGDKVYLADEASASLIVVGEGGFQKEIFLSRGSMPMRKALGAAGSIPYLNDNPVIQVVRASLSKPKVYTLDWEHINLLPDESLLVMSGDVVYVASTPASKWHRFVSGFLPSLAREKKTN